MNDNVARFPRLALFSLPSFLPDGGRRIELGVRGDPGDGRRGARAPRRGGEPPASVGSLPEPLAGGIAMDDSGRWYRRRKLGDQLHAVDHDHRDAPRARRRADRRLQPAPRQRRVREGSRYGTRILHGMMTSALMGAAVGMYFHGTAVAYLEHSGALQGAGARRRHAGDDVDDHRPARQAEARRRRRRRCAASAATRAGRSWPRPTRRCWSRRGVEGVTGAAHAGYDRPARARTRRRDPARGR